ncbi:MAG: addiction module toxin RelE [Gammaproteobacteria bacterium]|nr:addiction module toxin RelE [Gammaproteobacteria bacterium]NIR83130.1 addiction module toxin RelE [Gammaproteobacteria bacterium]NIR90938.1 addiction module toxin RelE [Gammaproteobacteria bacterium]NIU04295.1 addiction module toxin RelE [Gammaproteobacteria bacterium]NIV52518.1 addiction module toxin RelE [Gammaproteobacteria bacterium]
MARPLRIQFPGALYHLTARGNRRESIFLDDKDRHAFLRLLGESRERLGWGCYAYCLMTNHFHLVVETPEANLARGMRQLNGVYTQRFNQRHGRVGHLFEGRYKSVLVDRASYLLELVRYVVLNPVRARMVQRAHQWPWSSYRATAAMAPAPAWLEVDWVLSQFGSSRAAALRAYVRFVDEGIGASPWQDLNRGVYLGDDDFISRCQTRCPKTWICSEIPLAQRRAIPLPLTLYARRFPDRKQAMTAAFATGYYTLKQIAEFFGVHYSTVSRAVGRTRSTAGKSRGMRSND